MKFRYLVVTAVVIFAFMALFYASPEAFMSVLSKEGIIDGPATSVVLLFAIANFSFLFLKTRKRFFFAMGIASVFFFLEENDWGQNLLKFKNPDFMIAFNHFNAFNFHNFDVVVFGSVTIGSMTIIRTAAIAFFIVYPLVIDATGLRGRTKYGHTVPSRDACAAAVLIVLFRIAGGILYNDKYVQEIVEFMFGLLLLCFNAETESGFSGAAGRMRRLIHSFAASE
jgi:hypothetical protein